MNKCIFIGNLTRDPEFSTTGSGASLCRFSIAVSRNFKREGEPDADFFNIVTWRGLADNCHKYLTKGSKVCVVGSMQNRTYVDKEGNNRYVSDVVAEEVEFVGSRNATGETPAPSAPQKSGSGSKRDGGMLEPVDDSDVLPF
jgi:single-strand DNA-binding protein